MITFSDFDCIIFNNPLQLLLSAKLNDPEFETVSENVIDNRQADTKKFRKVEYTIKLTVNGRTFFASAFTKKGAKNSAATEAWNIIRTGTMT